MPTPSAWIRSDSSWLAASFCEVALATFRILPRNGSMACVARSRACLAEPPAESPSTMNSSAVLAARVGAIGELARQPQLARRGLAGDVLFLAALDALLGDVDDPVEQPRRLRRAVGQPVIEGIAHRVSTIRAASCVASLSLVWPWNSGSRMNTDSIAAHDENTSSAVILSARLLLASSP